MNNSLLLFFNVRKKGYFHLKAFSKHMEYFFRLFPLLISNFLYIKIYVIFLSLYVDIKRLMHNIFYDSISTKGVGKILVRTKYVLRYKIDEMCILERKLQHFFLNRESHLRWNGNNKFFWKNDSKWLLWRVLICI